MLLLLIANALAGSPVVSLSASGGVDYPTANSFTGVEVAKLPSAQSGVEWIGSARVGWGFKDNTPIGFVEAGGLTVLESVDTAKVRVGVVGRLTGYSATVPLPIRPGGKPLSGPKPGFVPAALGVVDFEWGEEAFFAVGLKGGLGSIATDLQCGPDTPPQFCVTWVTGFVGGFYARARTRSGFAAEAVIGPSPRLSLGYAFGSGG